MTETFQIGDRVRRSGNWTFPVGTVREVYPTKLVVSWDGSAEEQDWWHLCEHYETHLVDAPAAATRDSALIARLRSASLHITEALDHAVRALSGEGDQRKARHEQTASAIANAARACAEAAYELGREWMR